MINFYTFSLEHIDLSNNNISDIGGVEFARQLKKNMNLISINLSMNGLKSDSGIAFKEAVCDHTKLLKVNIEQNSVNVKDIEAI